MTIMTIGDTSTIAPSATATIGPTAANGAWVIHNIYVPDGASIKVEKGDGTNWVHIDTVGTSMLGFTFHATYTDYFRLTNMDVVAATYGYDGVSVV